MYISCQNTKKNDKQPARPTASMIEGGEQNKQAENKKNGGIIKKRNSVVGVGWGVDKSLNLSLALSGYVCFVLVLASSRPTSPS